VCKTKQLGNYRAKPKQDMEGLDAPRILSLDDAIEYLGEDELLEVTPSALRIRKKELNHEIRQRAAKRAANGNA
jgi:GTP-binding protein